MNAEKFGKLRGRCQLLGLSALCVALLLLQPVQHCNGWWDSGHMITADIAAVHLANPQQYSAKRQRTGNKEIRDAAATTQDASIAALGTLQDSERSSDSKQTDAAINVVIERYDSEDLDSLFAVLAEDQAMSGGDLMASWLPDSSMTEKKQRAGGSLALSSSFDGDSSTGCTMSYSKHIYCRVCDFFSRMRHGEWWWSSSSKASGDEGLHQLSVCCEDLPSAAVRGETETEEDVGAQKSSLLRQKSEEPKTAKGSSFKKFPLLGWFSSNPSSAPPFSKYISSTTRETELMAAQRRREDEKDEDDPNTVLNGLLSRWEEEFPGTGTITSAAIWPDLIKCTRHSDYCQSDLHPSLEMFSSWHYVDLPYMIDSDFDPHLPPDKQFPLKREDQAAAILKKIVISLETSKSRWAWNFNLRLFIHIFGDLHQPCHAVTGYSRKMPHGDMGGNMWKFPSHCPAVGNSNSNKEVRIENLHAFFDAVAGLYTKNWRPPQDGLDDLLKEIREDSESIIKRIKVEDALDFARLGEAETYRDFAHLIEHEKLFDKLAEETFGLAGKVVYADIDLSSSPDVSISSGIARQGAGGAPQGDSSPREGEREGHTIHCPTDSYVERAKKTLEAQLALGGYRLSIILRQFAKQYVKLGLNQKS